MYRRSQTTIDVARAGAKKPDSTLSLLVGGLHGLVIGMQIAFLAIQGAIPASWIENLPVDRPALLTFVMTFGALVGALVAVAAVALNKRRANRHG
jgi:hypothetical protein